ncbi:MAG: hypothetical protein P8183_05490, partial [Anaerolineae bacterium]
MGNERAVGLFEVEGGDGFAGDGRIGDEEAAAVVDGFVVQQILLGDVAEDGFDVIHFFLRTGNQDLVARPEDGVAAHQIDLIGAVNTAEYHIKLMLT